MLSKAKRDELFEKKRLNIDRLKEGLKEYNKENNTDYKVVDNIVQGSVAMSTVTQNDDNDYDIDVAVVFEKDSLPPGTTATKNIVVNALKRKCTGFKTEPEAKTNCVRIVYAEGYHIDFAIYRRQKNWSGKYQYEHCGSQWRDRDPRAINSWFSTENADKGGGLREVVRLLKMFSKSREWWDMPGGLIQTVLANERFEKHDRIDEQFYYTLSSIKDRLGYNKDVYNPTDSTQSLNLVDKDNVKIQNLYNRLNSQLSQLEVLFEDDCSAKDAITAWGAFFNHDFWEAEAEKLEKADAVLEQVDAFSRYYGDTEEFIENLVPVRLAYELDLDCMVTQGDKSIGCLKKMRRNYKPLVPGYVLHFVGKTNTPEPYQVLWKVLNRGPIAVERDCVRGQIFSTPKICNDETTDFKGDHYVECYIVKDGVCVAKSRIDVPIKVS